MSLRDLGAQLDRRIAERFCHHDSPTYADRLIASQLDGLAAERKVVKLQRSLDVYTGIAREAHQRIDRLAEGLSAELRNHQATRRALNEEAAYTLQLRTDNEELVGRVAYLERELEDTQRGYQQLKEELFAANLAARTKKKGKR